MGNGVFIFIIRYLPLITSSSSLAAFYSKIRVGHVEAGLRSYDIYEPFPEEVMRQMTSRVAELHFAPTGVNKLALMKEGISLDKIFCFLICPPNFSRV